MLDLPESVTSPKRCASISTHDGRTEQCILLDGHFGMHHGGVRDGTEIWWTGGRRSYAPEEEVHDSKRSPA